MVNVHVDRSSAVSDPRLSNVSYSRILQSSHLLTVAVSIHCTLTTISSDYLNFRATCYEFLGDIK